MRSSERLEIGKVYTRAQLKAMFDIVDASINNGIFRPKGHDSIWLFVTENKTADRTQYHDELRGDDLTMQGQLKGLTDRWVADHETNSQELLLFYRESKQQYPGAGFVYEGRFRYSDHEGSQPTTFFLKRIATDEFRVALEEEEAQADNQGVFDLASITDARHRTAASIVRRRGQKKFRDALLGAYGGECAVTRCSLQEVLEAAHIHPYKGDQTNVVQNGLLLRTDIHTLFDLGLITIDPETLKVLISPKLQNTEYGPLHGTQLKQSVRAHESPSRDALSWHRGQCDW